MKACLEMLSTSKLFCTNSSLLQDDRKLGILLEWMPSAFLMFLLWNVRSVVIIFFNELLQCSKFLTEQTKKPVMDVGDKIIVFWPQLFPVYNHVYVTCPWCEWVAPSLVSVPLLLCSLWGTYWEEAVEHLAWLWWLLVILCERYTEAEETAVWA